MKKVFMTIFALFYLVSSLGFASVHHYCHMMQKSMQTRTDECCCSHDYSKDADACHVLEKVEKQKSCCGSEENDHDQPDAVLVSIQADCCETATEYNQIDITTLVKIADTNIDVAHDSFDFIRFAYDTNLKSPKTTFTDSDPSIHLNQPLLI